MTSTTASRYQALASARQPVLDRARECSALTIPMVIPPEGQGASTTLATPYQSVGARCVITLTSKTLTTILPPNTPFFRLDIEEYARKEIGQNPGLKSEIEEALAMVERTTSLAVETSNIRVGSYEALQHLIISGNVLVYVRPEGGVKVFGLDNFVCLRDPSGNAIEIIARERVAREALDEKVAALLPPVDAQQAANKTTAEDFALYTHLRRTSLVKWEVSQSINDIPIPATEGGYPHDEIPWMALRWNRIDGEDYGRGHVEPYLGDFKTLEGLMKAVVEFAAGAAKVIALVNPNGVTDEADLAKAQNFEFVSGVATDVSFLRIDKYADLQVAKQLIDDLTQRLYQAFLIGASIQRNGDRVTAEEIRFMAAELEETIGGVYALLAQEFQMPLVKVLMGHLTKQKRLPPLPKGLVSPTVTTGLDALSRASDLVKLDRLMGGLRDLYGPEALAQETNVGDYVKRRATALGLDIDGLVKSEEQKQSEQQQRMQMEMMNRLGPNAVNQMGAMATAGMEQQPNDH
jgi:hypothetical protein